MYSTGGYSVLYYIELDSDLAHLSDAFTHL